MVTTEQKCVPTPSLPPGSQLAWSLCDWVDHVAKQPNPPKPWTILWQPSKIGADYSAILQNGSQYALVIQGTHGAPDILEDLACEFWAGFDPVSGAKVAIGAQAALFDMLMQTSSTKSDLGTALQSIAGSVSSSNPLLVTGHSLGGTLAALAACWIGFQLLNNQQPLPSLPASILAITFAPYAAGNQKLAAFLNGSSNYVPCLNQNDAVPHAWATDTTLNPLFNIGNLYNLFPAPGPNPLPTGDIKAAIQNKVTLMQKNQVSYVQTAGPNSYQFAYASKKESLWDLEAAYQHNDAYANTFASTSSAAQTA
jgi:hypothetical protein